MNTGLDVTDFSVVVPVFECADCLDALTERLVSALNEFISDFEILLVDDASTDGAWNVIERWSKQNPKIRGVKLSRNFGQHAAILAGIERARGHWVVVMDCDLQDRPELIRRLYETALGGFDQVVAIKKHRKHTLFQRITASLYVKFLAVFCGVTVSPNSSNFGIYNRRVISQIRRLTEQNLTFGLAAMWVGFKRAEIEVEHDVRYTGSSSYSIRRLIRNAIDGFTSFSERPLKLVVVTGISVAVLSLIAGFAVTIGWAVGNETPSGWASLLVALFLVSGMNLICLGIVGLYVGRTFDQTKARPRFIVQSVTELQ